MTILRANKPGGFNFHLGNRLKSAADFVADSTICEDLVCADVGCDHGYLSIYMIRQGICKKVYATDIAWKPIEKARENIALAKIPEDKISLHLCDGLSALCDEPINRVVICGMGGEVISGIIERAKEFHRENVKFVLQPMSRELELRAFLCDNGFTIEDEKLVRDSGRVYAIIKTCFTGKSEKYSPSELILGKQNIERGGELLYELCSRKMLHAGNIQKQQNTTEEEKEFARKLYSELSEILEKNKGEFYDKNS